MTPLNVGDQVDRFRIERLVARGGMASVYAATDLDTDARVALKIPHPEVEADVVFFDRFRREASICCEMDHPGVVRAVPVDRPGRLYLALEWVEGRTLREILDETGPLEPARAVRIAISVCDALDYLHSRGVVHRDLKPENIMIGAGDSIRLLDFGIAAKTRSRRLTFGKLSRIMGTVDYISPEQVRGKRGDARSDIYALGAILFEMLTGRPPFDADNPLAAMNHRVKSRPPALPHPAEFNPIVQRMLARDPADRYCHAADVAHDLAHPYERKQAAGMPTAIREKRVLAFSLLAMIPSLLFVLLFYVAARQ
jgi:serine/threonine-protein kinase